MVANAINFEHLPFFHLPPSSSRQLTHTVMHGVPRSSAEILASAPRLPPKKVYKPRQSNPFSSNEGIARLLQEQPVAPVASTSNATNSRPRPPLTGFRKFMPPLGLTTEVQPEMEGGVEVEEEMEVEEAIEAGEQVGMDLEDRLELWGAGSSDNEIEPLPMTLHENFEPTEENVPQHGSPTTSTFKKTRKQCFEEVLDILRSNRLSPFDLMVEMLDESEPRYSYYRTELYKAESRKLRQIVDHILSTPAGRRKLDEVIFHHAVALICQTVNVEMERVKDAERLTGLNEITPEFIKSWSISGYHETAPTLSRILLTAAESASTKEKNKKKTPDSTCNIVIRQLVFQRSQSSLSFPAMFGLFLWGTGSQRQTIEALHRCGLSVSYTSVLKMVKMLADSCMRLAKEVGNGPHGVGYDNVNLSTSIFVEQRGSLGPAKVTSGTFAVLYILRNAKLEHMKLAPILERLKNAPGLDFNRDIRPTRAMLKSFESQLLVIIVNVLTRYCKGFKTYADHPALQHKPRRPIPDGYITQHFPTRATVIEEATVKGNLLFHDDLYLTQLQRDPKTLSEFAIPTYNDQLTNSRIRSGQITRLRDLNPWTRRQIFQLGFGLFHLCLNLIWLLLHVHRGSLDQPGSLTWFFALMEKVRLGGEHPDYHSLLAALMQILHSLLLNAWRAESGMETLARFADSKPSPETLLVIARRILQNHATPMPTIPPNDKPDPDEDAPDPEADPVAEGSTQRPRRQRRNAGEASTQRRAQHQGDTPTPAGNATPPADNPDDDVVHQNVRLLTRDLLYVAELIQAISDGDIGRIEDFLPKLAMIFRGAGGNNYCTEILYFIWNLRHVWTPEFADIMRDNMLVNFTGQKGHSMPIDLNIEHLIGELKNLLDAKGLKSTWDRLGNISAAIDYMKKIKKKVSTTMNTSYQSMIHTSPVTDHLVLKAADKLQIEVMEKFIKDRAGNSRMTASCDCEASGEKGLKSSTTATFNKKATAFKSGRMPASELVPDVDTLPPPAYDPSYGPSIDE